MKTLIQRALHGLKTSGRKLWELLADVLCKMGFAPTRDDDNVWIKPREDGCDYTATHADDFVVVAKDCTKHVDQIEKSSICAQKAKLITSWDMT